MSHVNSAITMNYEMIDKSLNTIGMSTEARYIVYKLLSAILNISNIQIEESDNNGELYVSNVSKKCLNNVASSLDVTSLELEKSLLTRAITVAGTAIT